MALRSARGKARIWRTGFVENLVGLASVLLLVGMSVGFFAPNAVSAGAPYMTGLIRLRNSVIGPGAFIISLIAITVAGAALIFEGKLNTFCRSVSFLVFVLALIISAQNMLSNFFGR